MPGSDGPAGKTAALFQLLQRRYGLCLIFRAVAREVTHELPADSNSADAAKADPGIAEGECDLRSQARPISAFDPYGINALRGAHARFPGRAGHSGPLDWRHKKHSLARVFRGAPRKHHFEVRPGLGERLEL